MAQLNTTLDTELLHGLFTIVSKPVRLVQHVHLCYN
jgi:hypothetical protein